ncbi:MAG: type II toxin-antitoxin system Phd/YefM family antitoxin [Eubacteriaceae bacterium]|nr:type II toxin-antitoxin system Phd/YefM family antitoxin [Eubacteriaceae bacterium]
MNPIIKPSSELRKNYHAIAEICKETKQPVFITKNGRGDTVIMDMQSFSEREEQIAVAQRLITAERARISGASEVTVDEFEQIASEAIKIGSCDE